MLLGGSNGDTGRFGRRSTRCWNTFSRRGTHRLSLRLGLRRFRNSCCLCRRGVRRWLILLCARGVRISRDRLQRRLRRIHIGSRRRRLLLRLVLVCRGKGLSVLRRGRCWRGRTVWLRLICWRGLSAGGCWLVSGACCGVAGFVCCARSNGAEHRPAISNVLRIFVTRNCTVIKTSGNLGFELTST